MEDFNDVAAMLALVNFISGRHSRSPDELMVGSLPVFPGVELLIIILDKKVKRFFCLFSPSV
jgi:hypothetical protein